MIFVFALIPLFSGPVFGQNSSDDIIHGRCLDGHDFWRQGIIDITQIGKDGQVFVNQESHIVSSVLHKNNQSETIHLRLQITSPHPDSKLDQTKQVIFDKCDSVALVYWTFTPMVPGKHKIELREQEGGSGYSSSFIVKDPDGKSLRDYIPAPLKQYESGINPSKIVCEVPLQMVLRMNGTPACVKQVTMVKLWDRGWVKPADGYIKFSSKHLRDEFQSKITSKENAIKISQDYLRDNNLSLSLNMSDPKATISATLFYAQLADGQQAEVDVKPDTGLPVEPMPPWSEKFYRNPNWWSELQKDYLGMESHRIEQGNLVWGVTYGEQPDCICIGNYAEFLVDAITGKIIRVPPPELLSTLKHANADPDSDYRMMTILGVSPKNVTLSDYSKPKIDAQTKIPINKSEYIKVTNIDLEKRQRMHSAKITITDAILNTSNKNSFSKPGFDVLEFSYSIENKDNVEFFPTVDFKIQFGQKKYSAIKLQESVGLLPPNEEKTRYITIPFGKGANQIVLNAKDVATEKTLWSIPIDLTPYKIKYRAGHGNLIQE